MNKKIITEKTQNAVNRFRAEQIKFKFRRFNDEILIDNLLLTLIAAYRLVRKLKQQKVNMEGADFPASKEKELYDSTITINVISTILTT